MKRKRQSLRDTLLAWGILAAATCGNSSGYKPVENVIVSSKADNNLHFTYDMVSRKEPGFEFGACAYGKKSGNTIFISDITSPYMNFTTTYNMNSDTCPQNLGGLELMAEMHSHPTHLLPDSLVDQYCNFSNVDKNSYSKINAPAFGLVCGTKDNVFYRFFPKNNLDKSITTMVYKKPL